MPMHEDYMKDYMKDYGGEGENPMYPQMPMMGMMHPCPMMGGMPMHSPMMGQMPMYPSMPGEMPMYPSMPGENYPVMGAQDMKDLCYMEHMHEYMAYMCKAEACKMRAMQCMHKEY